MCKVIASDNSRGGVRGWLSAVLLLVQHVQLYYDTNHAFTWADWSQKALGYCLQA